jgi:hypothetical protein
MRSFLIVFAILACAASASASLQITLGNNSTSIPDVNNFKTALTGYYASSSPYDINRLFNGGADVKVTEAGTIEFYYHASESGFTNEFVVGGTQVGSALLGGTSLFAELIGGTPSGTTQIGLQNPSGLFIGSINVAAGAYLSSLGVGFRVADTNGTGGTGAVDALAGTPGFGVFYKKATYDANSLYEFSELFFGFDDNGAGPDDNHDDMIVRARFVSAPLPVVVGPVPEATSVAMWIGLVGLAGWAARRSTNRAAAA